jgi:hypothetical protein
MQQVKTWSIKWQWLRSDQRPKVTITKEFVLTLLRLQYRPQHILQGTTHPKVLDLSQFFGLLRLPT